MWLWEEIAQAYTVNNRTDFRTPVKLKLLGEFFLIRENFMY
jgi:hypothetical protein